jgi:hypothetical protein
LQDGRSHRWTKSSIVSWRGCWEQLRNEHEMWCVLIIHSFVNWGSYNG